MMKPARIERSFAITEGLNRRLATLPRGIAARAGDRRPSRQELERFTAYIFPYAAAIISESAADDGVDGPAAQRPTVVRRPAGPREHTVVAGGLHVIHVDDGQISVVAFYDEPLVA